MKTILIIMLALLSVSGQAKDDNIILSHEKGSVTFVVDKNLPSPKQVLKKKSGNAVVQQIINKEQIPKELHQVVRNSFEQEQIICMGDDNLFKCFVQAYADHRPLVLSPDIIWLIICQGFSNYVNAHPEEMRNALVYHEGNMDIIVESEKDILSPDADWNILLKDFAAGVAKHTKGNVSTLLTSDFSTTGTAERVASQITLMESVKSYFTYHEFSAACGFPFITIKGTPEDWQKVLNKTQALSQYQSLKKWSKELEPVLNEFIKAAQGEPNLKFWQNIVKKRRVNKLTKESTGGCGGYISTQLDGWFLKFFPTNEGTTYKSVDWDISMPTEMARVSFTHQLLAPTTGEALKTMSMELWAGFVGVTEDSVTFALTPKIGWFARISNEEAEALSRLEYRDKKIGLSFVLNKKDSELPEVLSKMKHIHKLDLLFFDIPVILPTWLERIQIDKLFVRGKLSDEEISLIRQRFPQTELQFK